MIKRNIKMRVTPEQSKKIQEICFNNSVFWAGGIDKDKINTCGINLYIDSCITHDTQNDEYFFTKTKNEEINADFFIKTNGSCKPIITESSDNFKKIKESFEKLTIIELQNKIENLRIALEKTRTKVKNQALEITKLLEQKKKTNELFINQSHCVLDMTAMLEHQKAKSLEAIKENERLYNYSMEQIKEIEDLKQQRANESKGYCDLKKEIDDLQEENSKLEEQLKEKDTIISYLESKLK